MAKVANIDRTPANLGALVHDNFADGLEKWVSHISPVAGLFDRVGDKGYTLIGKKLVLTATNSYRGGYMATDGYIPEPQNVDPVALEFTAARCYISGAIDNFLQELGKRPEAVQDYLDKLEEEMWDAVERGTAFQVHGSAASTLCVVTSRTSATVVVVEDAYGVDGAIGPTMFIEPGMILASLDASGAFAVLGAGVVSDVAHRTSTTTATVTFAASIEGAGTIAAGDLLVRATTQTTTDAHFVTERSRGPNGLIDIIDPFDSATTYAGLTEASTPRINPVRNASTDIGQVELMEFGAQLSATSGSPVTLDNTVFTMHPGVEIELAKELIPYQQSNNLGMELRGGWRAVKIGNLNTLTDPYHLHNVIYALNTDDLFVIDLGGEANVFDEDGSRFQRMLDYDGKQWYIRWYGQRGARRRNRMGALTAVNNPNASRFSAIPV